MTDNNVHVRDLDGTKVALMDGGSYFTASTPSMHRTAAGTGAEFVLLLAPGVAPADVTDDEVRALVSMMREVRCG